MLQIKTREHCDSVLCQVNDGVLSKSVFTAMVVVSFVVACSKPASKTPSDREENHPVSTVWTVAPKGYLIDIELDLIGPVEKKTPDCFIWPNTCVSEATGSSMLITEGETIEFLYPDPGPYVLTVCAKRPGGECEFTGSAAQVTVDGVLRTHVLALSRTEHHDTDGLFPDAIEAEVKLQSPPTLRPDGMLCETPRSRSGFGCSSNDEFYRCTVKIPATTTPGKTYTAYGCYRSMAYEMIQNKLCTDKSKIKHSEFAARFSCQPIPVGQLPDNWSDAAFVEAS